MSTADTTASTNGGSSLSMSGFLTSLDWIDPAGGRCVTVPICATVLLIDSIFFGRLVFVTTNHVERLDPALSIPGRMDVWVKFTHVTKWQAMCLFKLFFLPSRPSTTSPNESLSLGSPREDVSRPRRGASVHATPVLEEEDIVRLARHFADAIPEGEISVWPNFSQSLRCFFLNAQGFPVREPARIFTQEQEVSPRMRQEGHGMVRRSHL